MATKPSVFISYRRDPSSDLARYIRKELVDAGAHVFLDVDDIDKGRFENVIRSNIENSESFLLLLSPETLQSEWVRREVNHALDNDKNIIPLMMPDFSMEAHVPEELAALRRLHGIPYNHHYAEAALEKVKKAVGVQKQPMSLSLWLTKRGCSLQLTIGAVTTILVAVFAAIILPSMNNQNALNVDGTALDRTTSTPLLTPTPSSTETPTRTTMPPNTTATQVIDFGATATEAILQRTVAAQEATNAVLMTENAASIRTPEASLSTNLTEIELASTPIARNSEWIPIIQSFDEIPMVLVPAGCFTLGSEDGENFEKPPIDTCFDTPFWIAQTEVTNKQYGSEGYWGYPGDNRPRDNINWIEAERFCENRGGRLPTEIEWEFAARGPDNRKYAWGNIFSIAKVIYGGNSDQSVVVGSIPEGVSWVGALDMNGNLWEWTASRYGPYTAEGINIVDNLNDTTSTRVLRGGSWTSFGSSLFLWTRLSKPSTFEFWDVGFRCMLPYQ